MGLLRGVLGNGADLSLKVISFEFEPILIEGEVVERAFKISRDMMIFTNKRLIVVNKLTYGSSKVECLTIPYLSIKKFSKECVGLFNKIGQLKLWIIGDARPMCKVFTKDVDINEVYQLLSKYTLNC